MLKKRREKFCAPHEKPYLCSVNNDDFNDSATHEV